MSADFPLFFEIAGEGLMSIFGLEAGPFSFSGCLGFLSASCASSFFSVSVLTIAFTSVYLDDPPPIFEFKLFSNLKITINSYF